jgi:outer membrane protein OmpA-like peptidoglycan-associated protein
VFLSAEWAPAYHEPAKAPPPATREPMPPPPPDEPPPDRDHDGVADTADACPDQPGPKSEDLARNGCPPDRDNDGILDDVDACPDQAGAKNADPTENGCPPDRDGDGVYDADDACPDAPGPGDPDPHRNGCPLARIEDGQVKIVDQIRFATGSSAILRESDPTLLAIATTLKAHAEITKVRIEGYTDNTGKDEKNKELSYQRAHAVENWLVSSGIAAGRLESKGYGSVRPISTNETPEGRQLNRRVELHIAEQRKR